MDSFPLDFTPSNLTSSNPLHILYKNDVFNLAKNPNSELRISWDNLKDLTPLQIKEGLKEIYESLRRQIGNNDPSFLVTTYTKPFAFPSANSESDERFFLITKRVKYDDQTDNSRMDARAIRQLIFNFISHSDKTFPKELTIQQVSSRQTIAIVVSELRKLEWDVEYGIITHPLLADSTEYIDKANWHITINVPEKNENETATTQNQPSTSAQNEASN